MLDIDLIYSKTIIFRDVGFYILTILVILAIAVYGEITWWNSSILLGLYVVMVMVTVFKDLFIAYE
jgi:Ca2+/Na+ antiporter